MNAGHIMCFRRMLMMAYLPPADRRPFFPEGGGCNCRFRRGLGSMTFGYYSLEDQKQKEFRELNLVGAICIDFFDLMQVQDK